MHRPVRGFISKLESELGVESSHALGLTHGIGDELAYQKRIDAINYALAHDDGLITANYHLADVVLTGVSLTAKPRPVSTSRCSTVSARRITL